MSKRKCPNCQKKKLRERGADTLRNIRLRKKGDPYDKFVCGNCDKTFSEEEIVKQTPGRSFLESDGVDW